MDSRQDFEGQRYFPRLPVLAIPHASYVAQAPRMVAEEINRNVVAIHEVTGSTAQHARQTADASEEIAELAAQLQQRLGGFRI